MALLQDNICHVLFYSRVSSFIACRKADTRRHRSCRLFYCPPAVFSLRQSSHVTPSRQRCRMPAGEVISGKCIPITDRRRHWACLQWRERQTDGGISCKLIYCPYSAALFYDSPCLWRWRPRRRKYGAERQRAKWCCHSSAIVYCLSVAVVAVQSMHWTADSRMGCKLIYRPPAHRLTTLNQPHLKNLHL